MADPELPARAKLKRKRRNTLDPEELTARFLNELQSSRNGIDKELAKYNNSFLKTQSQKRQQFIDYCGSRLRELPSGMRSMVATRLLSSEDFAVEMNFSELHTSSAKSCLTWSCTDASLSDPSWKTRESPKRGENACGSCGKTRSLTMNWHGPVLQKYAGGAAEFSSPRAGKLARATRVTSKSSSPAASPSPPVVEPKSLSNSMALPETEMTGDQCTEAEEDSDDPLSTSRVTILRATRARGEEQLVAPLGHGPLSPKGRQAPNGKEETPKKHGSRIWSTEECDTLVDLCSGKSEAWREPAYAPAFWRDVEAQLPRRTQIACFMKWKDLMGKTHKKRTSGAKKDWSQEESMKLMQLGPRPGKLINWAKVAAQLPGRTVPSCKTKFYRIFIGDPDVYLESWNEAQSPGMPDTEADEINGELMQGNRAAQEAEGYTETSLT